MTLALFAAPFAPTVAIHYPAAIDRQVIGPHPLIKGPNGRGVAM